MSRRLFALFLCASCADGPIRPPVVEPPASQEPPPPVTPEKITLEAKAMGTHLAFAAYTNERLSETGVRAALRDAVHEFERLEDLMTTWRDSEVTRINRAAGVSGVAVSEETFEVFSAATEMSARSQGAFDVTFHTLHGLWKFDHDLDPHPPSPAAVRARLSDVGYKHVVLRKDTRAVEITRKGTQVGLGGIAKGYAVDKAAGVLRKAGVRSFFVQAGGDLYTEGKKPDGSEWSAGIRDPRGEDGSYFAVLTVSDHAFSTAGDYERSYIVNGTRYHHILDPRTGMPAPLCRSVTVWAKSAFVADAIDDAVFVLGPEEGLKLVETAEEVGAVIVDRHNKVWISERLRGRVRLLRPPSDGL